MITVQASVLAFIKVFLAELRQPKDLSTDVTTAVTKLEDAVAGFEAEYAEGATKTCLDLSDVVLCQGQGQALLAVMKVGPGAGAGPPRRDGGGTRGRGRPSSP